MAFPSVHSAGLGLISLRDSAPDCNHDVGHAMAGIAAAASLAGWRTERVWNVGHEQLSELLRFPVEEGSRPTGDASGAQPIHTNKHKNFALRLVLT